MASTTPFVMFCAACHDSVTPGTALRVTERATGTVSAIHRPSPDRHCLWFAGSATKSAIEEWDPAAARLYDTRRSRRDDANRSQELTR